mmetsp:Transcript_42749/g.68763  ORF Transcript_42749/g.68763 Transcript_42749/m.68763 type:complete len:216 (-) Transcript_42749:126-773(-)
MFLVLLALLSIFPIQSGVVDAFSPLVLLCRASPPTTLDDVGGVYAVQVLLLVPLCPHARHGGGVGRARQPVVVEDDLQRRFPGRVVFVPHEHVLVGEARALAQVAQPDDCGGHLGGDRLGLGLGLGLLGRRRLLRCLVVRVVARLLLLLSPRLFVVGVGSLALLPLRLRLPLHWQTGRGRWILPHPGWSRRGLRWRDCGAGRRRCSFCRGHCSLS